MNLLNIYIITFCLFFGTVKTETDITQLHSLNTLTIRPWLLTLPSYKIETLDYIVHSINLNNEVPLHVHVTINNNLYTVYKGINLSQEDTTVFIFSRGYAKTNIPGTNNNFIQRGACVTAAYTQLSHYIVNNSPIISFDYDDSRSGFAFGQTTELNALQTIYQAVLEQYPQINIVLIGDCRGGKVALELAAQQPKNLKALILMAPFVSMRELTDMLAKNYLGNLSLSRSLLYNFFKIYFPLYDEKKETLEQKINLIPSDLPIFIAHRQNDTLVNTKTIKNLEKRLKNTGNTLTEVLIINDTTYTHSRLTSNTKVQQGINAFLRKHGLPHHPELASAYTP